MNKYLDRLHALEAAKAPTLLHRLLDDGFTLEATDGTLYVSPAEQITDGLGAEITQHKPALLALLSQPKRIDWFADVGLREHQ